MDLDPLGLLGDVSASWLLLSLIPSAFGVVLFMYGRKQSRMPHLVAGVVLMVYPMVATTVRSLVIGGLLIGAGLWYAIRMDW